MLRDYRVYRAGGAIFSAMIFVLCAPRFSLLVLSGLAPLILEVLRDPFLPALIKFSGTLWDLSRQLDESASEILGVSARVLGRVGEGYAYGDRPRIDSGVSFGIITNKIYSCLLQARDLFVGGERQTSKVAGK